MLIQIQGYAVIRLYIHCEGLEQDFKFCGAGSTDIVCLMKTFNRCPVLRSKSEVYGFERTHLDGYDIFKSSLINQNTHLKGLVGL